MPLQFLHTYYEEIVKKPPQYSTQFPRAQGCFSTKDRFFRKNLGKNAKNRPAPESRAAKIRVRTVLPEVGGLVVEALVALGRHVPAEVALHAVMHQVVPVFLVVVGILCVAAGLVQLVGAVTGKGKAIALAQRAVMDGIPQAAGLADDGRRAVAAGCLSLEAHQFIGSPN